MPLFFDGTKLPQIRGEYVLWLDGMGTARSFMSSLEGAAHFIFKLHQAFDQAITQLQQTQETAPIRIYPLMDGLYLTTSSRTDLKLLLQQVLRLLGDEFLQQQGQYTKQFMVRGGIAYGASLHGSDIPDEALIEGIGTQEEAQRRAAFSGSSLHKAKQSILISTAMTPAYYAERLAPPFGIYIDNSALTAPQLVDHSDMGFSTNLWRWWSESAEATAIAHQMASEVIAYLQSAEERSHELGYALERIHAHRRYAIEYFREFLPREVV